MRGTREAGGACSEGQCRQGSRELCACAGHSRAQNVMLLYRYREHSSEPRRGAWGAVGNDAKRSALKKNRGGDLLKIAIFWIEL